MISKQHRLEYAFTCDHCGDNTVLYTGDEEMYYNKIIKLLRSEGWRIGKTDLCPNCSVK